jgi:predicted exporter
VRAGLWLLGITALAATLAGLIHLGAFNLQSNLLALLPAPQRDAVTAAAMERLAVAGQRRLILVFSAPEEGQHRLAARTAARTLADSEAFVGVVRRLDDWLDADQRRALQALHERYRFQLLAPSDRAALEDHAGRASEESAPERFWARGRARIYSLGVGDGGRFIDDPFGLTAAYRSSLSVNPAAPKLRVAADGALYAQSVDGARHSVVFARGAEDPFSLSAQEHQSRVLTRALERARAAAPDVDIRVAGVLRHAVDASRRARTEIALIGTGSIIGLTLLMLWAFRGVGPLVFSLLVIGGGCLLAVVATAAVFGNIHILTLVFGASLVGVAIDYCFHFYARRWLSPEPWKALRGVLPAISLGLMTSVLAYGSMAWAPFPGLRQMAVFAAFGLIGAWLGVILLLPAFAGPPPRPGPPLRLARRWFERGLPRLVGGREKPLLAAAGVSFCLALGIAVVWLQPADDIRLLYSSTPDLLEDERRIAELLGIGTAARAIVVRGADPRAVLHTEAAVLRDLRAAGPGVAQWLALTQAYPSPAVQRRNHQLLRRTLYASDGPLERFLTQLGFGTDAIRAHRADFASARERELAFSEWLASPAAQGREFLWLGRHDGQWASLIMLHRIPDARRLEAVLESHDNAMLLDRVEHISDLLRDYRGLATGLLLAAYALVWLLLSLPFGPLGATGILLPPILASVVVAALFAVTGGMFSLFNLFALILLLGMGADYGIFLRMAQGAERAGAMAAVSLSAATTLLAFGLLALSRTPALHSFGLTLALGVILTFLSASLLNGGRPVVTDRGE